MSTSDHDIAVVGMAGRFPGANTLAAFWQNLHDGRETISFFSEQELLAAGIHPQVIKDPNYVNAYGLLEGIELFDASFFGYSPNEAKMIDPQQRLFLECCWEALEHAGYSTETCAERIGVYAGAGTSDYLVKIYSHPDIIETSSIHEVMLGNEKDFLATRVSYKLNLKGPAIAVQTACSTSLVAVHLACQSLLTGETDMALAGGVSINIPQVTGYIYQEGLPASPDGHCRAFDAEAKGTISGSGLGVVVLKRLEDALDAGDYIHAVIKGSAINNDGAEKIGYAAPSSIGQAEVIAEALAQAEVDPETISYIEAHGTGTPIGDPIEFAALTRAFRNTTAKKTFCALGSVKTNVGHLDTAAGVTGLIKVILALKHRQLPASLHFCKPNPEIDLANSPFYINTTLTAWEGVPEPRLAGVSSFGMGGTNAHVVLEEAPPEPPGSLSRSKQLLLLSAKTQHALTAAVANLLTILKQEPDLSLADIAYTLQIGRRTFSHKCMLVCDSVDGAIHILEDPSSPKIRWSSPEEKDRSIVFMFPGHGVQYLAMGMQLYATESVFREQVDRCAEILRPQLGIDLRKILYSPEENRQALSTQLDTPSLAFSAIFATEYALACLWQSWGIEPQAMIGYSLGEYTAACLAGVLSLPDALWIVARRGQLAEQLPEGAMLGVTLSASELTSRLTNNVSLALINTPSMCTVAGSLEAIQELELELQESGVETRRMAIKGAFHSALVEAIIEPFAADLAQLTFHPPRIPYISNVTGQWITREEATSPAYWIKHLRQTVQFAAGIQTIQRDLQPLFLEVGPGNTISTLVEKQLSEQHPVLYSLRHPHNPETDTAILLQALGGLWLAGISVDWNKFYANERRKRIPLPAYAFERQRYWIDDVLEPITAAPSRQRQDAHTEKYGLATFSWQKSAFSAPPVQELSGKSTLCWLVFAGNDRLSDFLVKGLRERGERVISVIEGKQFSKTRDDSYSLSPYDHASYQKLFMHLAATPLHPDRIVHLWGVSAYSTTITNEQERQLSFREALVFSQSLQEQGIDEQVPIIIVAQGLCDPTGMESRETQQALVMGAWMALSQNRPCRIVDIVKPVPGSWWEQQLVNVLTSELVSALTEEQVIAYRGSTRWVQIVEDFIEKQQTNQSTLLRPGGVYILAGVFNDLGFALAEYFARTVQARLVFAEYRPMETDLFSDAVDVERNKAHCLQVIEEQNAQVYFMPIVSKEHFQIQEVIEQAQEYFGAVHGIVYLPAWCEEEYLFGNDSLSTIDQITNAARLWEQELDALENALQNRQLDFCSIHLKLRSPESEAEHALQFALSFLTDARIDWHNRKYGMRWQNVNWDTRSSANAEIVRNLLWDAMSSLGPYLFSASSPDQLITTVNNGPTGQVQETWGVQREETAAIVAAFTGEEEREKTDSESMSEIEQTIATLWYELLGTNRLSIQSNFFELGGNSLMGSRLIGRMRETFPVEIPLRLLFERPTIAQMAEFLETALVKKINDLSEEEAQLLLSRLFGQN